MAEESFLGEPNLLIHSLKLAMRPFEPDFAITTLMLTNSIHPDNLSLVMR